MRWAPRQMGPRQLQHGVGCQKNPVIRGQELSAPPPTSSLKSRARDWANPQRPLEQNTNGKPDKACFLFGLRDTGHLSGLSPLLDTREETEGLCQPSTSPTASQHNVLIPIRSKSSISRFQFPLWVGNRPTNLTQNHSSLFPRQLKVTFKAQLTSVCPQTEAHLPNLPEGTLCVSRNASRAAGQPALCHPKKRHPAGKPGADR